MGFWEKAKKKKKKKRNFYGILERQNDGGSPALLKVDSFLFLVNCLRQIRFHGPKDPFPSLSSTLVFTGRNDDHNNNTVKEWRTQSNFFIQLDNLSLQ